ncbi:MAG: hypothetical protein HOG97_08225 [Candidatus Marinimicrobia bacterium]|nr:hypothetical protein [Candidatus Neomarinimicrobiota bacterium]MBT6870559.1 hypothetical protein [Candidatus Neomarinimicrobiota bacterium]
MKLRLTTLLLIVSVLFSQSSEADNSTTVYHQLIEYKKSGKHFELVLNNQMIIYVSEIVEFDSLGLTVNILSDRRMGQSKSFESLVKQEIENERPKLLRTINNVDILAVNESRRSSAFSKIPYSPKTLIVIVPLVLLFVKFISTMMVG